MVLKVKIDRLTGVECFLNFGGSIATAGSEKSCAESLEYTFTYQSLGQSSNVYLVALSTTSSAHIKFSYWAEPRFSFGYIVAIVTCSIVFLTLLVIGAFFFILNCSID